MRVLRLLPEQTNVFCDDLTDELYAQLQRYKLRIVFAESCTAGLIAASLARIPGISEWLAGSAVVYQVDTKSCWLGVSRNMLARHGAVSEPVSQEMAAGVLRKTPHADIAVSVTGHLGPNAPSDQDGIVWVTFARRTQDDVAVTSHCLLLDPEKSVSSATAGRHTRQILATRHVLQFCLYQLRKCTPP